MQSSALQGNHVEHTIMVSYNPVTGVEVDRSSEEKKDLLMVEGGDEVSNLFKYVGKVLPGDTYQQVWTR